MNSIDNTDPGNRKARLFFCLSFIIYSIFVVYGSLVPLEFQYIPFSTAIETFKNLKFISIEEISRINWTTNIILGIPTSFFAMGWVHKDRNLLKTIFFSFITLIFCAILASTAEFLQIFFSSRNPSMNDIVAQIIGGTAGIIAWLLFGTYIKKSIINFFLTHLFSQKINFIFWTYILFLFLYNVMPLDLTLNPTDIYKKWEKGYINLKPFGFNVETIPLLIYNTLVDILIWSPIAIFLLRIKRVSKKRAVGTVVSVALIIEFIQLFVISRITDITDLITAFLGGITGVFLCQLIKPPTPLKKEPAQNKIVNNRMLYGLFFFLCWFLIVATIYWFPFDFVFDKNIIRQQLGNLNLIPFVSYQANGIYNAITQFVRKIIFFIPAGVIIFWTIRKSNMPTELRQIMTIVYFLIIAGVAAGIELGQFFLPGRIPDFTDWCLELIGAFIGFFIAKRLFENNYQPH